MTAYQNFPDTPTMPIEIELWIRKARSSNRFKYAAFFRDLIQTIPKESAKRVLRDHLQRDPRYKGVEITDLILEGKYVQLT
jgi:hypothetical protein